MQRMLKLHIPRCGDRGRQAKAATQRLHLWPAGSSGYFGRPSSSSRDGADELVTRPDAGGDRLSTVQAAPSHARVPLARGEGSPFGHDPRPAQEGHRRDGGHVQPCHLHLYPCPTPILQSPIRRCPHAAARPAAVERRSWSPIVGPVPSTPGRTYPFFRSERRLQAGVSWKNCVLSG